MNDGTWFDMLWEWNDLNFPVEWESQVTLDPIQPGDMNLALIEVDKDYNSGRYADISSVPLYSSAPTSDRYITDYLAATSQYDPSSLWSHSYGVVSDNRFSTKQDAFREIYTNPTPANNYPEGVQPYSQSFVAPFGGVTHYINPSTGTLFNVTNEGMWSGDASGGHLLAPGFVERFPAQDSDGNWRIVTIGQGMGFPGIYSNLAADALWGGPGGN